MQTNLGGGATLNDRIDTRWEVGTTKHGHGLDHIQEVEIARQGQLHGLAIADDAHLMGFGKVAEHVGTKILKRSLLSAHEDIVIAETIALSHGVELHTLRHGAHGDIGFTPYKHNHRIDDECQQKVNRHTANHHQ